MGTTGQNIAGDKAVGPQRDTRIQAPGVEALIKILRQEDAGGYLDSTVIGGLDRFLQRQADGLKPALGVLSPYGNLTPLQRRDWAEAVVVQLGNTSALVAGPPPRRSAASRSTGRAKEPQNVALDDPVTVLKGVARRNEDRLRRLGIEKVGDLLYLFPNRHNDYGNVRKIAELEYGEEQTVLVSVWEATEVRTGPKGRSTQAVLGDDSGNVRAIWFNNPYLVRTLKSGTQIVVSGKVNAFKGQLVFESPEYELLQGQEELVHTGRLVPVYPTVEGIAVKTIRRLVKQALDLTLPSVMEFLPDDLRHRAGLLGLQNAIGQIHYPDTIEDMAAARHRLAFDELLILQLIVLARKLAWQTEAQGIPLRPDADLVPSFLKSLPWQLTGAQARVLAEILHDLGRDRPMSRLVQGDVGSGKTVVAAAALLVAAFNGHQGALMAPTEILAEQHFLSISRFYGSAGQEVVREDNSFTTQIADRTVTVGLLVGSLSKKVKNDIHERIADGQIDVIIGTQAIIQEGVDVPNLALAVVDEQHRFGVMQRASLRQKGARPHMLAMSATPIPRSLALTVYGDLDVSVVDEMPPGRQQIKTRWVPPDKRAAAYQLVRREVAEGRQALIICPLIEELEVVQARAATEEYERLSSEEFPELSLGLLHGRMALREKGQVMDAFQGGRLHILVSTAVVEVGVDVANATVMLIEGANRFGLAQLHQFRGRVGRGTHQSYCVLLSDAAGVEARERLKLVERIQDGFELAEEDLRLRGPGDYMGTRQSGLPDLKIASITDHEILSIARREAGRVLDADPKLEREENCGLAAQVERYKVGMADEMS